MSHLEFKYNSAPENGQIGKRIKAVTDTGGRYRFDGLVPGVYLLEIADPPIYVPTTPLRFAVKVQANAVTTPPGVGFYRPPWVVYLPLLWR